MITTSKGFLDALINSDNEEEAIVSEGLELDTELDLIISEDCGDITIGEWAFLTEDNIDEMHIQLLEEVLDEIENDLIELDVLEESELSELLEEDEDILYEAVGTTIKRIAKVAKKSPMRAAKLAGKRATYNIKKAGSAAYNKLKTAATAALEKSRKWKTKAANAIKGSSAYNSAMNMASKLAQKAKNLKDRAKEALQRFRLKKAQKVKSSAVKASKTRQAAAKA